METGFWKKEKESLEATIAEQKRTNKDLKEKLKGVTAEKYAMSTSETTNAQEKERCQEEIEQLKGEINEKDTQIIELELNWYVKSSNENSQRLESEMSKQKKQRADDMANYQDSKSLLEQIKGLHVELLNNKEQYETQISGLELEKGELERKLALITTEKNKLEKSVNEECAQLQIELAQCKENIVKNEEQIKIYETALSRKSEYSVEDKQVKELLNKVKEENARLREELVNKSADEKENATRMLVIKVCLLNPSI